MDDTSEVKTKTDIVAIISEYVDLKKSGRNYKAPCPFHSEKTPSFMVSSELQIFKCFGCGESGDVFAFLQKHEGMEFYEALKYLADRAGVKLKPRKFDESGIKEKLYQINKQTAYFYKYILTKHPAGKSAYNYLTVERRLTPETIDLFGLGFAPDSPTALKNYMVGKKKYRLEDLEKSGTLYTGQRGSVDRFRGRVMFPLSDHRGNVVGFAGRVLPTNKNPEIAKYINSPETDIYHKSKVLYGLNVTRGFIKKSGIAVVVEGEIDLMSSFQAGIKNIVAIKGSALTHDQAKLMARYAPKVVLALDTDFAGNEAARRGLEILQQEGLEVKVGKPTGFKDPDEAAHKAPDVLKKAIDEAVSVWDFIIDSIFEKYKDLGDTGQISRSAIPFLASIADEIVRAHYINVLASRLGVPNEAVNKELEKFLAKTENPVVLTPAKNTLAEPEKQETRKDILEERLVSLIFKSNPEELLSEQYQKLLKSAFSKRILEELVVYFNKRKKFDLKAFSSSLRPELFGHFSEIIMDETDPQIEENPDLIAREINIVKRELAKLELREKLDQLTAEIKRAEATGDSAGLVKMQSLFAKATKKLNTLAENEIKGIIS